MPSLLMREQPDWQRRTSCIARACGCSCSTHGIPAWSGRRLLVANFSGSLTVTADISGEGSLAKQGAGTLTLTGANTYTGGTTVDAGTVVISDVGENSVLGTGSVLVGENGTLAGNGRVAGPATVEGTLSPGNSAGLIAFDSALTLESTATIVMELGGYSRGIQYDAINVTGSLTYGGVRSIVFLDDFTPEVNDTFALSSENLRKFLDTVAADATLRSKVGEILTSANGGDVSGALENLSAEQGLPVSAEEFRAHAEGELGIEQLGAISGGVTPWKNIRSPFDESVGH